MTNANFIKKILLQLSKNYASHTFGNELEGSYVYFSSSRAKFNYWEMIVRNVLAYAILLIMYRNI